MKIVQRSFHTHAPQKLASVIHTSTATAVGGRAGSVRNSDGVINVNLVKQTIVLFCFVLFCFFFFLIFFFKVAAHWFWRSWSAEGNYHSRRLVRCW
jgi:hypothetical protein